MTIAIKNSREARAYLDRKNFHAVSTSQGKEILIAYLSERANKDGSWTIPTYYTTDTITDEEVILCNDIETFMEKIQLISPDPTPEEVRKAENKSLYERLKHFIVSASKTRKEIEKNEGLINVREFGFEWIVDGLPYIYISDKVSNLLTRKDLNQVYLYNPRTNELEQFEIIQKEDGK